MNLMRSLNVTLLDPSAGDLDALLGKLTGGVLDAKDFAKGNTKVFLRNAQAQELETARETALSKVATRCKHLPEDLCNVSNINAT